MVRPPPIISLKLAAKWRIQVLRTTVTISDDIPENTKQYAEQRGTTASREARSISSKLKAKTQEIGASQAKKTFDSLLDRVKRREEIVITRHGKPVARLVASSAGTDRQWGRNDSSDLNRFAQIVESGAGVPSL